MPFGDNGLVVLRATLKIQCRLRSGALHQLDDEQQNYRTDERVDDGADEIAADQRETDLWQQPACDNRTDDADNNVADQSKPAAFDNHAGEPASDCTDDQPNNNAHRSPLFCSPRLGNTRLRGFASGPRFTTIRLHRAAVRSGGG